MTNRGVAPPEPDTPVGQFRILYGDTAYTELDPSEEGFGDYEEMSDEEIEVFLDSASGSVLRAIGDYYSSLSGQASKKAVITKDHDLSLNFTLLSQRLKESAELFWARADEEESINGESDFFEVVTWQRTCTHQEAAPWPVGCVYCA